MGCGLAPLPPGGAGGEGDGRPCSSPVITPQFIPNRSDLIRAFAPKAAIVLAFLLVFGLVGGWILAGGMLAPLTRITDATRLAANGSLSHRIWLPGRKDEFRELADAFDAMLARLEAHVAEQQRFAANASHELRTPLAITQTLLPFAEKRGLSIETSGNVAPTIGSHALLLQMTTNLVHNAIVHNLAERGTVWVTTSVQPKTVVLTIENTGETLAPQMVSTLVEPFQRGTERVRTDHAGVGLGLAIVKSITKAHDGTLTLTARPAGGLRVTVQLPAAPHTAG